MFFEPTSFTQMEINAKCQLSVTIGAVSILKRLQTDDEKMDRQMDEHFSDY